jgi:hypothetical protein
VKLGQEREGAARQVGGCGAGKWLRVKKRGRKHSSVPYTEARENGDRGGWLGHHGEEKEGGLVRAGRRGTGHGSGMGLMGGGQCRCTWHGSRGEKEGFWHVGGPRGGTWLVVGRGGMARGVQLEET